MTNNRFPWLVYKAKSKSAGTPEPTAKPSTAGKEAPKVKKVGQSMGKTSKGP